MISAIRYHWSVAACFARLSVQRQLEYPLFLVSWLLMIPISFFSVVWMLHIMVSRFHALDGWGFPQLEFVYGLGILSHGLMVVLFINTWNIDHMVTQGEFDRLLLRPLNVFFQVVASYINFIGCIDLIPGIIIFLNACHLVGLHWSFLMVCKLLLTIIGGVLIRSSLYICLGSIAFWTKRNASLLNFTLVLLERTTMYPLTIYPYVLQLIFTVLIPVGFVCFYPAGEMLGKGTGFHFPLSMALWTPLIGVVCFLLSQWLFSVGIRKYESAGS